MHLALCCHWEANSVSVISQSSTFSDLNQEGCACSDVHHVSLTSLEGKSARIPWLYDANFLHRQKSRTKGWERPKNDSWRIEGKELEVYLKPQKNCQVSNHILGWELYANSNKLNNEVANLRRLDWCHKGEMASMTTRGIFKRCFFFVQNIDSQNHVLRVCLKGTLSFSLMLLQTLVVHLFIWFIKHRLLKSLFSYLSSKNPPTSLGKISTGQCSKA